ncbi:DUF397 domain-containing protein [Nocardiopsis sp. CC223A]|uniref:DUF397 domain-containing protein n=1 Tax=Nocardiopsis sp. CC223A TaxID=3044051 RepID=UPI0027959411|nr:DUF397 domain-containing protein [Nocardiopsis sp. CC223A]
MEKRYKSGYSSAEGSCVEVAEGPLVLVRDTRNRPLGRLDHDPGTWTAFLHGMKNRAF